MLPRDSEDELTRIKTWGFETALEDVLACNPTAINKFYRVQQEYRLKKLDLVDALEQSCCILMSDECLLNAFCDIPRTGYVFKATFDRNLDMWLLIRLASGEVIFKRLGGGIGRQSGECLLHLPHFSKAYGDMFGSVPRKGCVIPEETKAIMPGSPLTVDEYQCEAVTTSLGPGLRRENVLDYSVKEVELEPSISSRTSKSEGPDELGKFEEETLSVE